MRNTQRVWVLFDTHAPNEDDNWYGLVDVEPTKIEAAIAGLEKLRAEGVAASALDLDWSVWWFTSEDLARVKLPTPLGEINECMVLPRKVGQRLALKSGQRTECDTAVLSGAGEDSSIHWECYPKHGDFKVETQFMSWARLRSIVAPTLEAVG